MYWRLERVLSLVLDLPHRPHGKRERHVRTEVTVLGDELILSQASEFNTGR